MRLLVPALVLACLAGCTASHSASEETALFLAELARAACERESRCEAQLVSISTGTCHPSFGVGVFDGADRIVARGDASFDREAAARCLDDVRSLPCHSNAAPSAGTCLDVFTPLRREGEPCDPTQLLIDGCVAGTFCARTDGCSGVCAPAAPPLASCAHRPCAEGSCHVPIEGPFCSGEAPGLGEACTVLCAITRDESLVCRDGICVTAPVLALGEDCVGQRGTCVEGTVCDGLCRSPDGAVGDACRSQLSCIAGLWCDDGRCAAPVAPGEPCERARCSAEAPYCTRGICSTIEESFASCYPSSITPLWWAARECPAGQVCAIELQRCLDAAPIGESCDRYTACVEGGRCVDGTCRTIVSAGETCGPDAVCPREHECRDGRCAPLPVLGEPCVGECFRATCDDGRCVVRAAGEPCVHGIDCESGSCRDGVCGEPLREGEACGLRRGYCARGLGCLGDANDDGICVSLSCEG